MAFSRDTAFNLLRRAHEQNRLAHAYLFSGPPGSGKQRLAAELASLVNGTPSSDVFSARARDIFVAQPESKSRRIVIEQIRDLEHALQMRASNGRRKVAIVSDADRLQPQAANAFLKTLEEPPKDSLLLLLSALPEALPETILSRCIAIPLAPEGHPKNKAEEKQLVKLLQQTVCEQSWNIQYAYRLAQEFQRLLRAVREQIKSETDQALRQEETRYKDSTDGAWLEEREEYYKALTESFYLQRRAGLIETLFAWWSDVLRSSNRVERRNLPNAGKETGELASRFTTVEILRRIQRLEELRDHLSRNIQEALAIEVAFLAIFTA
ncbi:MAG: AAA family ATPase [Verrucomicrobia bacterium]|nr:MAG: AAA family ATPase [Verrucomicrobiota bacterium]